VDRISVVNQGAGKIDRDGDLQIVKKRVRENGFEIEKVRDNLKKDT